MSSWLSRLFVGLNKSSRKIGDGVGALFTGKRRLDDDALDGIEDILIASDLGVATAGKVRAALEATKFNAELDETELREAIAEAIAPILEPVAKPLVIDPARKPHVVLMVGVNGSGKTTTIGKLATRFSQDGHKVMLAAGDTFRAAAVEQLRIWGERTGCPVIARDAGADAAGLAFEALEAAQAAGADLLLIDTAGRLQNKRELMQELQKVRRVLGKRDADAPHDTLLALDATVGQNAHSQVETFGEMIAVTGLVLTKLDGSARGGVLVALADRFGLPVHAIGVGETADDLRPFEANSFARALLGLDEG